MKKKATKTSARRRTGKPLKDLGAAKARSVKGGIVVTKLTDSASPTLFSASLQVEGKKVKID